MHRNVQGVGGCRREHRWGPRRGSSAHTVSHGSWVELPLVRAGKETRITASERVVGKLLETPVKYKRCYFYGTNTSLYIFWKMFSFTPTHPSDPPKAAGPCFGDSHARGGRPGEQRAEGVRRGLRGGKRHKNRVRDMGRRPLARSCFTQFRNNPDPAIPVYTGPGPAAARRGTLRVVVGAECCTAKAEARGEASCVREGMGLSDGGGKKEGRL